MSSVHVMIDLETMGLKPNAAIVSIGAVVFTESQIAEQFHMPVSLASCTSHGLTTDPSTVDWWMKQSAEARSSWQRDDAPSLGDALSAFSQWLSDVSGRSERNLRPWGNGADFDLVLLKSAYNALNADPPWRYYNHRCFRTIKGLFDVPELPRHGVHHNALDDAISQAQHLQRICNAYHILLN